jgi:hypothetical protein
VNAQVTPDVYDVCRLLKRYYQKNGYTMHVNSPELGLMDVTREFLDLLVKNGVVVLYPLYDGGVPVAIGLTEKGYRMATAERKRRRHW